MDTSSSEADIGTGDTQKKPKTMGIEVPRARSNSKEDVFPGKRMCDSVEKKNADRPKPEITMPVVVARCRKTINSFLKSKTRHIQHRP